MGSARRAGVSLALDMYAGHLRVKCADVSRFQTLPTMLGGGTDRLNFWSRVSSLGIEPRRPTTTSEFGAPATSTVFGVPLHGCEFSGGRLSKLPESGEWSHARLTGMHPQRE